MCMNSTPMLLQYALRSRLIISRTVMLSFEDTMPLIALESSKCFTVVSCEAQRDAKRIVANEVRFREAIGGRVELSHVARLLDAQWIKRRRTMPKHLASVSGTAEGGHPWKARMSVCVCTATCRSRFEAGDTCPVLLLASWRTAAAAEDTGTLPPIYKFPFSQSGVGGADGWRGREGLARRGAALNIAEVGRPGHVHRRGVRFPRFIHLL
jgi:hypothetical protein